MSKKLLLADDSITIQKVIGITFANEDVTLAIADNGDSALEMARADRPDLVLADVLMPGRNGYELCEAVKTDPALAGVPVLLLTGTFEPFEEDKARAAGADDWIAKPFESQALIDRVQSLLSLAPDKLARAAASAVAAPLEPAVAQADMWREEPAEPAAPTQTSVSEQEEPVDADEDLWADFSLDEEDMSGDDLAAVAPREDEPLGEVFATASADDEEDDDILVLDDADILEEDGDDFAGSFGDGDIPALSTETASPRQQESAPAWLAEPTPQAEPEPELLVDKETEAQVFDAWRHEDQGAAEFASSVPPAFEFTSSEPAEAAQPAALEPAGLSEAAMEAIVERVAKEVVTRLAGTILEKVAWEVVPDLAESLIKDEIRKIKEALK